MKLWHQLQKFPTKVKEKIKRKNDSPEISAVTYPNSTGVTVHHESEVDSQQPELSVLDTKRTRQMPAPSFDTGNNVTKVENLGNMHEGPASTPPNVCTNSSSNAGQEALVSEAVVTRDGGNNRYGEEPTSEMRKRDIWADAYQELEEDDKSRLRELALGENVFSETTGTPNEAILEQRLTAEDIEKLLKGSEASISSIKKLEKDKKWKQASHKAFRVMDGLTKVKRLGDEAIKFDPTKYGALAWGVLTFGVEAAVRHHKIRKQALDSVDFVSHLLVQYAAFERRYRDGSDIADNFERELLAAYKATLHYCAAVQGYVKKHIPLAIDDPEGSDIKSAEKDIEVHNKRLYELIRVHPADSITQLITPLLKIQAQISDIQTSMKWKDFFPEDHLEVMRSIHVEYSNKAACVPEAGRWLVEHPDFTFWADSWLSSGLWLQGNMGVGKSTLAMKVVTTLKGSCQKAGYGALAYYYCDGKRRSQAVMTTSSILKAILRQLLEYPSVVHAFNSLMDEDKELDGKALTTDNVIAIIKKLICPDNPLEQTIIVIDGFDELSPVEQISITDHLVDLLSTEESLLKVFISSRPLDVVEQMTQDICWNSIAVQSSSFQDLETFVNNKIDKRWKPDRTPTTQESRISLKRIVKERAGTSFQYAETALNFVFGLNEIERAVTAAHKLPKDLKTFYQELYDKSQHEDQDETNRHLVKFVVTWLLGGVEHLTTSELILASQDQRNYQPIRQNTVLDCCRGMVVHNTTSDAFEFHHFSVQEFFQNEESSGEFKNEKVHERLRKQCMRAARITAMHSSGEIPSIGTYASHILERSRTPQPTGSFLRYVRDFWAYHCGQAGPDDVTPWKEHLKADGVWALYHSRTRATLDTACTESLGTDAGQGSLRYSVDGRLSPQAKSLDLLEYHFAIACAFDIPALAEILLQDGKIDDSVFLKSRDWDEVGALGGWDSVRVLNTILKHFPATSVEVTSPVSEFLARQLWGACREGKVRVVAALIQQWAVKQPQLREFLLTFQWGSKGTTPSAEAAREGTAAVFRLLIDSAAEPHHHLEMGMTTALKYDQPDIVQICVEREMDRMERTDSKGHTPLLQASLELNVHTVKRLLELGANVHATSRLGQGALLLAVGGLQLKMPQQIMTEVLANRAEIVLSLLERGAEVNQEGPKGQTALFLAVRNGFVYVVYNLLEEGADPCAQDTSGRSPLFELFNFDKNWSDEIISMDMALILYVLLRWGAEPGQVDNDGYTAAYRAYLSLSAKQSFSHLAERVVEPYGNIAEFQSRSGTKEALISIMEIFLPKGVRRPWEPRLLWPRKQFVEGPML